MLGGFGGQFSFGHALFFGTGAYVQAIAQMQRRHQRLARAGRWPWRRRRSSALFVGALTFRYGLKGSYFALVTLAFAEVFRILALSVGFTGGGVGADAAAGASRSPTCSSARARGYVLAGARPSSSSRCWSTALAAPFALRRLPAGGARQRGRRARGRRRPVSRQARRDRAVGRLHGRGGRLLRAGVPVHRPGHRLRPAVSVEALVAAIVGGMGTLWGPLLGAVVLHLLAELTRNLFGELPGINMVIYGVVLVVIVMFLPRGIARHRPLGARCAARQGARRWLSRCSTSPACRIAFGGLRAVQDVSLQLHAGTLAALIGPNGAGKTTLFALMSGFLRARQRQRALRRPRHHRPARRTATRALGMTRTFQIVQPFAAQTVRENIAVGAHLHLAAPRARRWMRRDAVAAAGRPRAAARQARRRPDGGRPQAARTGARAGHAAAPAAARRGAGRAQPAGDRRDDPGRARHRRERRHRADDRACDAGGDEPGRSTSGCWRRAS